MKVECEDRTLLGLNKHPLSSEELVFPIFLRIT